MSTPHTGPCTCSAVWTPLDASSSCSACQTHMLCCVNPVRCFPQLLSLSDVHCAPLLSGVGAPRSFRNTSHDTGWLLARNCGSGGTTDLWSCKNWPITSSKLVKNCHLPSEQLRKAYTAAVGMDSLAGLRSLGFHCLRLPLSGYFILFPFSLIYNITHISDMSGARKNMPTQAILSRCWCLLWARHVQVWLYCSGKWQNGRILGFDNFCTFSCLFSTGS